MHCILINLAVKCVCVCVTISLVESLGVRSEREDDVRENDDLVVALLVMFHQELSNEVGVVLGHVTGSSSTNYLTSPEFVGVHDIQQLQWGKHSM